MGILKLLRAVRYFLLVIGIIVLGIALRSGWRTTAFLKSSLATNGTVVEMRDVYDSDGSVMFAPVFRFTANGTSETVTSNTSSNPASFAVGDQVRVRYLPSEPAKARIDSWMQLWFGAVAETVIGVAFVGIGFIVFWVERLVMRSQARAIQLG
jgi:hypothetical protein